MKIGVALIKPSKTVRNLGVYFDEHSSMSYHVSQVCRKASYSLYRIGRIRKLLDQNSAEKLIHAFITSQIDYCNSLLYGIDDQLLVRLQLIQNSAARLLTGTKKHDHISHVLQNLHWLPVKARIQFKILVLVFKFFEGITPSYFTDMVKQEVLDCEPTYRTRQHVRQVQEVRLIPTTYKLENFGARAFSFFAPLEWNCLPPEIRNSKTLQIFKSKLKTFLFTKYYY